MIQARVPLGSTWQAVLEPPLAPVQPVRAVILGNSGQGVQGSSRESAFSVVAPLVSTKPGVQVHPLAHVFLAPLQLVQLGNMSEDALGHHRDSVQTVPPVQITSTHSRAQAITVESAKTA